MKADTKEAGVAAPIASQILGEVLPYLEVTKNQEEENLTQIEMPDITGITLKEAKIILKELGLDYEINIDEPETIITNQVPKKGIKVNSGTKVILNSQ